MIFTFSQSQVQERENRSLNDTIITIMHLSDTSITDASPQGGYDSLRSFIERNLRHPLEDVMGSVFVELVINKDGSASDFKIKRGLCKKCDQNATEVLKKIPKWNPAKVKDIPVRQKLVLPVKLF